MSDNIDDEDEAIPPASDIAQNMEQQIDTIILAEADNTTPGDELDATHGGHPSVASNLAPGLLNAVAKCADRIVSLAPQLISNQTSNLAEKYMSIRCVMDGGKQFNRIQSGSFEHHCTAAGLAKQHGPNLTTSLWIITAQSLSRTMCHQQSYCSLPRVPSMRGTCLTTTAQLHRATHTTSI